MKNKRHSLFYQFLLLSIGICCIIAVSFLAMLLYVYDYSLSSSTEVLGNLHEQTALRIEEYYTTIENEVYAICYSPTLQEYVQTDNIEDRIDMHTSLKSLHSGAYLALDSLIGIAAFDTEGAIIHSSMENLFIESLPSDLTDINNYYYTGLYAPSNSAGISRNCFAMLSPAYDLIPNSRLLGNRIGTIALTFNTDHLTAIIKSNSSPRQSHIILTDADGNVISASSNSATSYYQSHIWESEIPAASINSIFPKSGWHLYSFMPRNFMLNEIKPLLAIISVMGVIFLGLLFLLVFMLRQKILHPISKLSGFMARVPMDKKPTRFEAKDNNELGSMIFVMNQMLDDLDKKNCQLRESEAHAYAMELARKNMEILAYRNQINPHFLYNTLDCICSMAMYHGVNEVAEISESLSTMFRYAVKGDSFTTIRQEIAYVQEYASIINYRFMKRISIHIDAAPDTLPLQTLKLLIQPLVENSVFHGLEKRIGPGNVYVQTAIKDKNNLEIVVHDDGIGIQSDTLKTLREGICKAQTDHPDTPSTEKSIGLQNIARRIHLYYNGQGSICLHSTEEAGTTITIVLPLSKGEFICTE